MTFTQIIETIENELNLCYEPGAIKYCDEKFDNAWSKAIDRFDQALTKHMQSANAELIQYESELYRDTVLQLIKKYKMSKNLRKADDFFN